MNVIEPTLSDEAAAPAPAEAHCERKMFLANLGFEMTEFQLASFFSRFGNVERARIITDQRGLSKGFGFVTLADDESAAAVAKLAEDNNNTINMLGRHSVHLAPHDRERAARKAAERKAVKNFRKEQQVLSKYVFAGGGATPFMPYHPGMMQQHPQYSFPNAGMVLGGQQEQQQLMQQQQQQQEQQPMSAPQPASFSAQTMKVSAVGTGGPPFEIIVENIPPTTTLDQLVRSFSAYGEIIGASLRVSFGELSAEGRMCYGRVRFSNHQSMTAAVLGRRTSSSSASSAPIPRPQPGASYGLWKPSKAEPAATAGTATGHGATKPIDSNDTFSAWSGGSIGGAFTPTRGRTTTPQPPPGF